MPLPEALVDAVQGMLDSGEVQIEAIGSDIADPDVVEKAYQATPLAPLMSFQKDGLVPLSQRYGDIAMSLLLFTSTQDHVVSPSDSDALAATYGGAVERVILERSYHVATQDYDREIIFEKSVDFVHKMTA
jgi:carboxylesterase